MGLGTSHEQPYKRTAEMAPSKGRKNPALSYSWLRSNDLWPQPDRLKMSNFVSDRFGCAMYGRGRLSTRPSISMHSKKCCSTERNELLPINRSRVSLGNFCSTSRFFIPEEETFCLLSLDHVRWMSSRGVSFFCRKNSVVAPRTTTPVHIWLG